MDKKVMVICGNWYPKPMPVTICAKNVIKELMQYGYEVKVCSLAEDMDASGTVKDGDVVVYQRLPLFEQKLMYYADKRNNKLLYYMGLFISRLHSLLLLPFYPCDAFLLYAIWSKEINDIMKKEGITNIISFENPTEASWTAYWIKKYNAEYKWINYQVDCGADTESGSSFYGIRKILQKKVDRAYKKMMRLADYNIVMSGHAEHYVKAGFIDEQIRIKELDVPLINNASKVKLHTVSKFDNWAYAGALSGDWYDPTVLVNFFLEYIKKNPKATLSIWGYADEKAKNILNDAMKVSNGRIVYKGYVAHDLVEQEIRNADVLVYYMAEMKKSVSGKFFEYISYAKPVVFLSPGKGDVNERYIKKYLFGMLVANNIPTVKQVEQVEEFLTKIRFETIDSTKAIESFSANNPKEAASFINSVFMLKEGI